MTPGELARTYRLGPQFLEAWEKRWGIPAAKLGETEAGSLDRLWSEFILTTNLRGDDLAWRQGIW